MRALALLLLTAVPAAAQDLSFDPAPLAACVAGGGGRDCIGTAAAACMGATEGGETTLGMGACLARELAWWDAELNAAYQDLRAQEARADRAAEPVPGLPPRPSSRDAIRDVQRAWIAWRDAACGYLALQYWGGTMAGLARTDCLLTLTGEQALTLHSYRRDG